MTSWPTTITCAAVLARYPPVTRMEIAVGTPGTQFDIKDAAHTKADGWLPILMDWPVADDHQVGL